MANNNNTNNLIAFRTFIKTFVCALLLVCPLLVSSKFPDNFIELDDLTYDSQDEALKTIAALKEQETDGVTLDWLRVFEAKALYHLNRFSESQSLLIKVESKFEDHKHFDIKEMTLRLMGQNFYRMGGFDQAMTHALKAKLLTEEHELWAEQAQLTNMIAAIHLRSGDIELAQVNFQKALDYFLSTQSKNDIAKLKNNLGAVYIETNEFESASQYLTDALNLAIELKRPTTTISALVNQIELAVKQSKFDQANIVFNTCLERAADENLSSFEVWCLEAGAEMYQAQGLKIKAIETAQKAYQMAGDQKLNQSQIKLGKILVDLYAQNEQFQLAINLSAKNLNQVEAIKDEVLKLKLEEVSALNEVVITRSELKFEREQNKLNHSLQRLTWLGILILAPILIITLLLLKSKQKLVKALKIKQFETSDALIQMREAKELNEKLAKTDALTGLYNRREILRLIDIHVTAPEFNYDSFALMMDVDHFKNINDSYGHATGDEILIKLAQIITTQTPTNASCSRWGGEEFLIILHNYDPAQALSVAQNLVSEVAKDALDSASKIRTTVSIGVSQLHKNQSINDWIKKADEALYTCKKNGRNQVTF